MTVLNLAPLYIWEEYISRYCFKEFRLLSKETYNISNTWHPLHNANNRKKFITHKLLDEGSALLIKNAIEWEYLDLRRNENHLDILFHSFCWSTGQLDMIKYLLSKGANIDTRDKYNRTPLHLAVSTSRLKIVKYLISHGADINAQTNDGWSPLHLACLVNNKTISELLLLNGCDLSLKDVNNRTALYYARKKKMTSISKLLKERSTIIS